MKILIFGDGPWATKSLHSLSQAGHNLVGIVLRENPTDPELIEAAKDFGLVFFQPPNVNNADFSAQVRYLQPDLNLSISYDQILRPPILESAPMGFINFHAGKLPNYRGRNVINWAIINGETEIGLTGHYIDEGIDTGDIILQKILPISWTDSYGYVLSRVIDEFPSLVVETVNLLESGKTKRIHQANLPGTYFSKREAGDEWLDWTDTSLKLHNKIRAITRPAPGARTLLDNKVVTIWRAFYDPTWPSYVATPGQIVGRKPGEGVLVKTGDYVIFIQEVQLEGEDCIIPNWKIGKRLGLNLLQYLHQLEKRVSELEKYTQQTSSITNY